IGPQPMALLAGDLQALRDLLEHARDDEVGHARESVVSHRLLNYRWCTLGGMGRLDGRVAFLTGAGRGIGAATAQKLAAEGAAVAVTDMDPAPAEETAAAIRSAGGKAIAIALDVTNRQNV